jgi:hypothetical protein
MPIIWRLIPGLPFFEFGMRMIFPIGSSFGKYRFAKASLMITTAGALVSSRSLNGRPASSGMPVAEK